MIGKSPRSVAQMEFALTTNALIGVFIAATYVWWSSEKTWGR